MADDNGNILHRLYERLAGETPGDGARDFIRDLSWIGLSFASAKVVSSLVNIAAGRLLGPEEYGKINLMTSAGAIIAPFFLAGIQYSVVKYGVSREDRAGVFSTAAAAAAAFTVCSAAAAMFFSQAISSFLGISRQMFFLSLVYAAATSAFLLFSAMQQALGNFSKRGAGEIAFSLLLALGFLAGVLFIGRFYESMAYAYILAFGGVAVYWLIKTAPSMDLAQCSGERFSRMSEYGLYNFGASLASFLIFNVQGLLINTHLSAAEVGVYAAYYTATINVAGYLAYAINTVLFPKASSSTDRKRLWELAARSWVLLAPVSIVLFLLAETAVLLLMGRHQYGMDPALMLCFAVCGALTLAQSSLSQIFCAEGAKTAGIGLLITAGAGLINFAACLLLLPRFKILGVTFSFILAYIFMLFCLWKTKNRHLSAPDTGTLS